MALLFPKCSRRLPYDLICIVRNRKIIKFCKKEIVIGPLLISYCCRHTASLFRPVSNINEIIPELGLYGAVNDPHGFVENQYYKADESGLTIEVDLQASFIKNGSRATLELLKQYCYLNPNLDLRFEQTLH